MLIVHGRAKLDIAAGNDRLPKLSVPSCRHYERDNYISISVLRGMGQDRHKSALTMCYGSSHV